MYEVVYNGRMWTIISTVVCNRKDCYDAQRYLLAIAKQFLVVI